MSERNAQEGQQNDILEWWGLSPIATHVLAACFRDAGPHVSSGTWTTYCERPPGMIDLQMINAY